MIYLNDVSRERLNNEELEHKFDTLALLFSIDATTIKDRCERQKRYRDQTETNLAVEIDRLNEKIHRIRPLCVDMEKTELLTGLLAQVIHFAHLLLNIFITDSSGRHCDEGRSTCRHLCRKIWRRST